MVLARRPVTGQGLVAVLSQICRTEFSGLLGNPRKSLVFLLHGLRHEKGRSLAAADGLRFEFAFLW